MTFAVDSLYGQIPRLAVELQHGLKTGESAGVKPGARSGARASQHPPLGHLGGAIPAGVNLQGAAWLRSDAQRRWCQWLATPVEAVGPVGRHTQGEAGAEDLPAGGA